LEGKSGSKLENRKNTVKKKAAHRGVRPEWRRKQRPLHGREEEPLRPTTYIMQKPEVIAVNWVTVCHMSKHALGKILFCHNGWLLLGCGFDIEIWRASKEMRG
jgi:hypothetical protein